MSTERDAVAALKYQIRQGRRYWAEKMQYEAELAFQAGDPRRELLARLRAAAHAAFPGGLDCWCAFPDPVTTAGDQVVSLHAPETAEVRVCYRWDAEANEFVLAESHCGLAPGRPFAVLPWEEAGRKYWEFAPTLRDALTLADGAWGQFRGRAPAPDYPPEVLRLADAIRSFGAALKRAG